MNIVDVDDLNYEEQKKAVIEKVIKDSANKKVDKGQLGFGKMKTGKRATIKKEPLIKVDKEFIKATDDIIYRILSLPMKDPKKRDIFYKKLKESDYIKKYIQDKIYTEYINYINNESKFALIYGMTYYDVYKKDMIETSEQIENASE